ncbi:hypothetical protein [Brachyspira sp. SAP_772]|uniref:hypothetical protein n=1 Tax=Brachyspira sp. SAP_772 TaxID=2608385 RepID=UPI0012F47EA5|nr:hypothetical protein [Brachyspira sp. SAP_772]
MKEEEPNQENEQKCSNSTSDNINILKAAAGGALFCSGIALLWNSNIIKILVNSIKSLNNN